MKSFVRFGPALLFISVALLPGHPTRSAASPAPRPRLIGIATGPAKQVYFAVGQGLARVLNERWNDQASRGQEPLRFVTVATHGSLQNIGTFAGSGIRAVPLVTSPASPEPYGTLAMRPDEKPIGASPRVAFQIGLVSSAAPCFLPPSEATRLRGLAVLWREYLQLVVSPRVSRDVRSLADLTRELSRKNVTVFCGAPRSATREIALALLAHAAESGTGTAGGRDPAGTPSGQSGDPARPMGRFVEAADALPSLAAVKKSDDATQALIHSRIDAAFFLAGLPTPAVETALAHGCRLLSIEKNWVSDARMGAMEADAVIPAGAYAREAASGAEPIRTLDGRALLVCSRDLPDDDARYVLAALFDARAGEAGIEDLVMQHEAAGEIRLLTTLAEWRKPENQRHLMTIPFHPGADAFWRGEEPKIRIAAGPVEGMNYRLGIEIEAALEKRGIQARVLTTDGARNSMHLLTEKNAEVALVENDVASVDYAKESASQASQSPSWLGLLHPRGDHRTQLLSFLYPEAIHVLAVRVPREHLDQCAALGRFRATAKPGEAQQLVQTLRQPQDFKQFLGALLTLHATDRLALGDAASSDGDGDSPSDRDVEVVRHYARLLGKEAALDDRTMDRLSIAEAQNRLIMGRIAGVVVTAGVPMEAVQQLLYVPKERIARLDRLAKAPPRCPYCGSALASGQKLGLALVPLSAPSPAGGTSDGHAAAVPDGIQGLLQDYRWFQPTRIPPNTYPPARNGATDSVAVRVVLVCREDCPSVYRITQALVEDEVRLRSIVRGIDMRDPLLRNEDEPSIPMHPLARQYFADQNIVERLPPATGLWATIAPIAQPILAGFLVGSLLPWTLQWAKRAMARRRSRLEWELRDAYFRDLRSAYAAFEPALPASRQGVHAVWAKIMDAYEAGHVDAHSAEALDRLARDYMEALSRRRDASGDRVA
jgi:TRAP-type uncharacterized transport system substrate-binding protein